MERKYKITIRYSQLNNWEANLEFDFGKEVDIDYTGLIKKLNGYDNVIFVGGLSGLLEGEEMPVSYAGFKNGDRTSNRIAFCATKLSESIEAIGEESCICELFRFGQLH